VTLVLIGMKLAKRMFLPALTPESAQKQQEKGSYHSSQILLKVPFN
jgi:hypothetical protein